jgi:hypothetical protein
MTIIYNSISDEIRRKCENNGDINKFISDLLNLYKPNDKNKEGENLLTILLNEVIRSNSKVSLQPELFNNFLDKKFKIQQTKIKPKVLDKIIESIIESNTIKTLPKHLEDKCDYFYLMLPTIHTKKLMEHFYKKNMPMYDDSKKFNVLNYIFDKDLAFRSKNQVMAYLGEMEEVLTTLFVNKNLNEEHLSIFDDDKFINNFTYCIEKKLQLLSQTININALFGGKQDNPVDFNSIEYLKKLKATIFSEILKVDLVVNKQSCKVKKTNKI